MKFSAEPTNPSKACKAMGVDLRVHYKNTYEVCAAIKGMNLRNAQKYLEVVKQDGPSVVLFFQCTPAMDMAYPAPVSPVRILCSFPTGAQGLTDDTPMTPNRLPRRFDDGVTQPKRHRRRHRFFDDEFGSPRMDLKKRSSEVTSDELQARLADLCGPEEESADEQETEKNEKRTETEFETEQKAFAEAPPAASVLITRAEGGKIEFELDGSVYRVCDEAAFRAVLGNHLKPPQRGVQGLRLAQRACHEVDDSVSVTANGTKRPHSKSVPPSPPPPTPRAGVVSSAEAAWSAAKAVETGIAFRSTDWANMLEAHCEASGPSIGEELADLAHVDSVKTH